MIRPPPSPPLFPYPTLFRSIPGPDAPALPVVGREPDRLHHRLELRDEPQPVGECDPGMADRGPDPPLRRSAALRGLATGIHWPHPWLLRGRRGHRRPGRAAPGY